MCKSRKTPKQTELDKMLVKIADRKGNNLVSARELHKVLQVKEVFTEWIKRQLNTVDAVEDKDYIKLGLNLKNKIDGRGRPEVDYVLTIKIAGEIAMVAGIAPNANPETRKASKIVRQYFTDINELFLQMMLRSNDKAFQKEAMSQSILFTIPHSIKIFYWRYSVWRRFGKILKVMRDCTKLAIWVM